MNFSNNSEAVANFESWFIAVNILIIMSLILAILLAIIFLAIFVLNKTCYTVPMMLAGNSCVAEIFYGSVMLSIAVYTFENDMKQRVFQDGLCTVRDYLGYVGTALLFYSFLSQAMYRYVLIVCPVRISWRSIQVQSVLICFFWIFCFMSMLPWILTGSEIYNVDNQACILPFRLAVPIIYSVSFAYIIPISIIILIYFKLVRYVRQMSTHATTGQTLFQAKRELAMVSRIVTIITILITLGVPYTGFMLMSFITKPPKYHYRIGILFVDMAQALIMIALFKFSKPVMDVLLKFKHSFSNVVQPTTTRIH